ncbi:MAG: hypothetical protein IKO78_06245 [Bacilli bacterium]|nr:hypothetical protein [Bacilli bacterium]
MKEATGELNMTLVTIIAIAAVLAFVTMFLPNMLGGVSNKWDDASDSSCYKQGDQLCCKDQNGGVSCT